MVETFLRELATDEATLTRSVAATRELLDNIVRHAGGAVGFLLIGVQQTKSGNRVSIKTRNPADQAAYSAAKGSLMVVAGESTESGGLTRLRHEHQLEMELEHDGHELEFRVQIQ